MLGSCDKKQTQLEPAGPNRSSALDNRREESWSVATEYMKPDPHRPLSHKHIRGADIDCDAHTPTDWSTARTTINTKQKGLEPARTTPQRPALKFTKSGKTSPATRNYSSHQLSSSIVRTSINTWKRPIYQEFTKWWNSLPHSNSKRISVSDFIGQSNNPTL
jgi:hypothetical protein